ncbi:MAG: fumarylacetoacetate hydrolase family protein [Chloroflexi bacterium]|nr:fumarylacetoacetate hydrolase family protein [Chloroflexota bacterium]
MTTLSNSMRIAVEAEGQCYLTDEDSLTAVLSALEVDPEATRTLLVEATHGRPLATWSDLEEGIASEAQLLAPLDEQEVWASGVTYERSMQAREDESQGSGIYDRVYVAPRPELFFKAGATRVVGTNDVLYIRSDASWSVPEPELALAIGPRGTILGYTIGNDVSSRDIEGENPLYLPQAKVYARCCGLGPAITLAASDLNAHDLPIALTITRGGVPVFRGETSTNRIRRTFEDLARYLFRDNLFPNGVVLLTGTGIVPPDNFTLGPRDSVEIMIPHIGRLRHRIERGPGDHGAA